MSEFMLDEEGPNGTFAVFSEDEGAGYFFLYRPQTQDVLAQIRVYVCSDGLLVRKEDVQVMWSSDHTKCGVTIWGRMRGVINLSNGHELCIPLVDRDCQGITDPEWLKGFSNYLDHGQFIEDRRKYWREMTKRTEESAR